MPIKAFRFPLRTEPGSERLLRGYAGSCRWAWTTAITEQRCRCEGGNTFADYAAMCRWLTDWCHAPDTAWLAEPHPPAAADAAPAGSSLQAVLRGPGWLPRFKRRGQEPGLRFPYPKQFALDQTSGRARLPKLRWLQLRQSRAVLGELRNVSVTRKHRRWFDSLHVEQPTLGIDLGVALFAATSEGRRIEPLDALRKQQRRLPRALQAMSRKKRGSRNRHKAVDRLVRLHARIAIQRNDWLHKPGTELANQHPVIAIEDLRGATMSASTAGTLGAPASACARTRG